MAVNLSVSSHLKVQNTLLQFNKSLYTGKDTSRIASHMADPVNENMVVIALYRGIMAAVLLFISINQISDLIYQISYIIYKIYDISDILYK